MRGNTCPHSTLEHMHQPLGAVLCHACGACVRACMRATGRLRTRWAPSSWWTWHTSGAVMMQHLIVGDCRHVDRLGGRHCGSRVACRAGHGHREVHAMPWGGLVDGLSGSGVPAVRQRTCRCGQAGEASPAAACAAGRLRHSPLHAPPQAASPAPPSPAAHACSDTTMAPSPPPAPPHPHPRLQRPGCRGRAAVAL